VAAAQREPRLVAVTVAREPNDICWYPRSKNIFRRGIAVVGRVEHLEDDDGEPPVDD
jgi:hypothetical protein